MCTCKCIDGNYYESLGFITNFFRNYESTINWLLFKNYEFQIFRPTKKKTW